MLKISDKRVKPNGLLKLISIVKECCYQWTKDLNMNFRTFIVNEMLNNFKEYKEHECVQYFDFAVKYQFIIEENDNEIESNVKKDSLKRYVLNNNLKENSVRDWFCFDCDILLDINSDQTHGCHNCWRVFHTKCSVNYNSDPINDDYKCAYCKRLDSENEGFIAQKAVNCEKLNTLIEYMLHNVITQITDGFKKFLMNLDSNQQMVVFKEMDLKLIEQKAVFSKYKKLLEFENDCYLFVHNFTITSNDLKSIKNDLRAFRAFLKNEIKELNLCVDCYDRSNDQTYQQLDENWFCEPCDPPHEVRFVKTRFSPPWPSKVIENYCNGRYNVRFFDKNMERMDVKAVDTFPIDDCNRFWQKNTNKKLKKPLEMLEIYLKRLKDKQKTSGEIQPNTSCGEMSGSSAVVFNVQKRVESVAQKVYETKSPHKKTPNSKQSLLTKETSVEKVVTQSQSQALKSRSITSFGFEEIQKVDKDLDIDLLSSIKTTYKKSKRKSRLKKFKNDLNANDLNVTKEKFGNTEDKPQLETECKQMEVINETVNESIQNFISLLSLNMNSKSGETRVQNNNEPQMIATNDNESPIDPQINVTTDSQCVSTETTVNNDNKNEELMIDLTKIDLKESEKNINDLIEQLLKSNESDLNVIKGKVKDIKNYRENHIKAMKENFKEELKNAKKKPYCVVCQKAPQFYCCLRFYCSIDCQKSDWVCGHSQECLTLTPNKSNT